MSLAIATTKLERTGQEGHEEERRGKVPLDSQSANQINSGTKNKKFSSGTKINQTDKNSGNKITCLNLLL